MSHERDLYLPWLHGLRERREGGRDTEKEEGRKGGGGARLTVKDGWMVVFKFSGRWWWEQGLAQVQE